MGSTTAKQPQLSLAEMIDQHLAITKKIKILEIRKKDLCDAIALAMKAKNIKSGMGSNDEGYRLASWEQCDFPPEATEYIRSIKKTELFLPEPMITKARLNNGFKKGHLTATQYNKIKSFAGKDYTVNRLYEIKRDAPNV